jgi:hypothetical protein
MVEVGLLKFRRLFHRVIMAKWRKTIRIIMTEKEHPTIDNLPELKKNEGAREALRRYAMLSDLLRGHEHFGKLAKAILLQPMESCSQATWDSIKGYERVLGALISFLPVSTDVFQSLKDTIRLTADSHEDYSGLYSRDPMKETAAVIGNQMRKKRIGADVSVAEIGGSVACRVMEALGADCVYADAGYRSGSRPLSLWQKAGDFFMKPDELITLDRYTHRFDSRYDFTVSNRLLDPGSGAEAIAEGAGQESVSAGTRELLAVFSNITRYGGYSIHGGLNVEISPDFLNYVGFDVIFKAGIGRDSLTVFAKGEPHPDIWPDGVRIGHKTIHFDNAAKCFFTRVQAPYSSPQ